jgi:integrase
MVLRAALEKAVRDRVIAENPVRDLRYRKRKAPIRLTPTFEEFKQIVAEIRAQQKFNQVVEQSGDFIEFLGLAGLGSAEAAALTPADVDFKAGHIIAYRRKTSRGFAVPIFPNGLRPLLEKLCAGKAHNERLFEIDGARKALTNACRRLSLPRFTPRSLRRMFITRCLELAIDPQTIAQWQGHSDGGVLVLRTYGHVRALHSKRMAQLLRG